jgi:tyrosine-specific transport protein
MAKQTSIIGGILLVTGTCIGGGMLALPVLTSVTGFIPSLFIFFLCWLFMACTGLLFLEIAQWMHQEANIVSMAQWTLGRSGKMMAWVLYLFLFYSLNVAYIVELGKIVAGSLGDTTPSWIGPVLFVLLFSPCIFIPIVFAGRINIVLVIGLVVSYFGLVALGLSYVNPQLLTYRNWSTSLQTLPIVFTSFAYQGIVPTLVKYLDYDIQKARKSILIGSFIPFIAYAIWQGLIMGIIPIEGVQGLAQARQNDLNAIQPMKYFIDNNYLYIFGQAFVFFALVTSFLGVTLGLRDFLADGLKIKQSMKGKIQISLLIFIPPLLIAILYPHIFLTTLEYAGGIGCALLLGLLPVMMVWRGRYHLNLQGTKQIAGGKWVLALLALFVIFEVAQELLKIRAKLIS